MDKLTWESETKTEVRNMSDLPDYQRKIVVEGDATVDVVKVKGVALANPTVAACLPTSIENDAIAYDGTNDRFKVDVKKWTATDTVTADVIDKATRLLGLIYGSQGQQLLQRAATYELLVQLRHAGDEIDPRAIRALTSADVVDVSDKAARLLGIIYGSQTQKLQQKATTYELLTYDSFVATLLGAGLPAALDSGALKVKEQSPITGFATQTTLLAVDGHVDGIEGLLSGGLPAALDTGALKIREQNPLTTLAVTQATYANLKAKVDLQQLLGSDISLMNYLPTGIVYPAGTLIDPRAIRALTAADILTIAGTVAADNIIMDVLRVGAYTERRSILSNNGADVTWDNWATGDNRRSKFFPRGCRGFIQSIDLWCRDPATGGGTIYVYVAPYPGVGAVYSGTITVPSAGAEAWRAWELAKFWNYDSMFIWWYITGSVEYGRDNDAPNDAIRSVDAGATWIVEQLRFWARVIMVGETCGDVPVSGTVALGDRSAYSPAHITADAQVKSVAGRLHTVTVNAVTTGGVLTIYDNTAESGTVIAVITLVANDKPVTLTYDVLCSTGIYVGFDGTLVADVTVSYL
jgi:hypothetical protein